MPYKIVEKRDEELKNIFSGSNEIAETQSQADIQKQQEEALKKTEEEVKIAKLSEMVESAYNYVKNQK